MLLAQGQPDAARTEYRKAWDLPGQRAGLPPHRPGQAQRPGSDPQPAGNPSRSESREVQLRLIPRSPLPPARHCCWSPVHRRRPGPEPAALTAFNPRPARQVWKVEVGVPRRKSVPALAGATSRWRGESGTVLVLDADSGRELARPARQPHRGRHRLRWRGRRRADAWTISSSRWRRAALSPAPAGPRSHRAAGRGRPHLPCSRASAASRPR